MKWVKYIIIPGLIFLVMILTYFYYLLSPAASGTQEKEFVVSPGAAFKDIAQELRREHLIRSAGAFKLYSFFSGSAHRLKPGTYMFDDSLSVPRILRLLVEGPPDLEILITEGKTLKDIDSELAKRGLIEEGELANFSIGGFKNDYLFLETVSSLEGFLFPDTYRIGSSSSLDVIVKKFLDNFKAKAVPALGTQGGSVGNAKWYDDLIIASLIEKEIPLREDRRLVSGVLRKRLTLRMPLQVDATIVYAKCRGSFDPVSNSPPQDPSGARLRAGAISNGVDDCLELTKNDFKIQSDFNTYLKRGLPPTPIANPGLDAIRAARNPETSNFLYYLSDPETKKTVFAKTLAEHNINRARYLSSTEPSTATPNRFP